MAEHEHVWEFVEIELGGAWADAGIKHYECACGAWCIDRDGVREIIPPEPGYGERRREVQRQEHVESCQHALAKAVRKLQGRTPLTADERALFFLYLSQAADAIGEAPEA